MLILTLIIALICSATATAVEDAIRLEWRRKIGSGEFDRISGLRFDSNGLITMALWTQDVLDLSYGESMGNAHIAKYDTGGRLVWDASMEIPFKNVPAIALDKSDNVYVSGSTNDSPWCIAKLNKSGTSEWNITTDTDRVGPPLVAIDTAGNAFFTGIFRSSEMNIGVVSYDSNGSSRWTEVLSDEDATPVCSVVDSTGNLYVVGNKAIASPASTTFVDKRWSTIMAKFGPDGALLARYQGDSLVGDEFARACVMDNADRLYIAGQSSDFVSNNKTEQGVHATLMQINQTGSQQWVRHVVGRTPLQFTAIAADDQWNLYVVGEGFAARSNRIVLMKFTSDGTRLWSQVIGSRTHDTVTSILVDSALRRIFLAGLANAQDGYSRSEPFLLQLVESAAEPMRLTRPVRCPEDVDDRGMVMESLLVCFVVVVCWAVRGSLFGANWLREGCACVAADPTVDNVSEQKVLAAPHSGRDRDAAHGSRQQGNVEVAVERHDWRALAIV